MATNKPTTTKQPIYNSIDSNLAGGLLPGGAKPAGAIDPQAQADKQAQQSCIAQGGKWDPINKACIMPNAIQNQTQTNAPKNNDQIFKDVNGNSSGITIGGKTYLGLSPKEIEKVVAGEATNKFPATQAFEQGIAQQQQAQVSQQAVSQLGLSQQEIANAQAGATETPIDVGQALTAGVANIIPNAIGGAAIGATSGALVGGAGAIPGAAIGGAAGLVTGLFNGIRANIKSQQSGEISASVDVLTTAKSDMRKLASIAAMDPGNAASYVEAYNQRLAQVYQAQRKIKLETSGNLNKFMEDGTSVLSDFDLFLQPNGQAEIYRRQLELALTSGVPPQLTSEDLASLE